MIIHIEISVWHFTRRMRAFRSSAGGEASVIRPLLRCPPPLDGMENKLFWCAKQFVLPRNLNCFTQQFNWCCHAERTNRQRIDDLSATRPGSSGTPRRCLWMSGKRSHANSWVWSKIERWSSVSDNIWGQITEFNFRKCAPKGAAFL